MQTGQSGRTYASHLNRGFLEGDLNMDPNMNLDLDTNTNKIKTLANPGSSMVDASILIIENIHKKLDDWKRGRRSGPRLDAIAARADDRDMTAHQQAPHYERSLIEASLDSLVAISWEGKITDVNEATVKMTGIRREKLKGTEFSHYFTEPKKARKAYLQMFAQRFVRDFPLTFLACDGRQTDVLYNASVFKDVRGNVIGVFAAARDVTAQRKLEAEVVEQRGRELDRLADMERLHRLAVDRELKMIELKKELDQLKGENQRMLTVSPGSGSGPMHARANP